MQDFLPVCLGTLPCVLMPSRARPRSLAVTSQNTQKLPFSRSKSAHFWRERRILSPATLLLVQCGFSVCRRMPLLLASKVRVVWMRTPDLSGAEKIPPPEKWGCPAHGYWSAVALRSRKNKKRASFYWLIMYLDLAFWCFPIIYFCLLKFLFIYFIVIFIDKVIKLFTINICR